MPPPRAVLARERHVFAIAIVVVPITPATVIVIVVTVVIVVAAVAPAVVVVTTTAEVVAVIEMGADRTLPDPDRVLLVLVARRDVAYRHLDLELRVPALVVFGADASAGGRFRVATAPRIGLAIVAATELSVFPDDVAQRLERISDRDAAIVVDVADCRRTVAGVEGAPEDVQDIADGRPVAVAPRLAAVADARSGWRRQNKSENCGECE
jgi:hypothetical protein